MFGKFKVPRYLSLTMIPMVYSEHFRGVLRVSDVRGIYLKIEHTPSSTFLLSDVPRPDCYPNIKAVQCISMDMHMVIINSALGIPGTPDRLWAM